MCALHNQIIFFVPWFMTTYLPSYIKLIESSYQNLDGTVTQACYPPQSAFILPNNTGMTFSAFQKFITDDVGKITVSEINNLISQNNYLSLYVKVLGEHISSLDTKLDELIVLVNQLSTKVNSSDIPSTSKKPVDVDKKDLFVLRDANMQDFDFYLDLFLWLFAKGDQPYCKEASLFSHLYQYHTNHYQYFQGWYTTIIHPELVRTTIGHAEQAYE